MQNKVKLTKRQIKEDKFTTFMLNAKSQFLENWQFYVIGIAVVILIIAGLTYYVNDQRAKHEDAGLKFANAVMAYRTGQTQVAKVALSGIVEDYGDEDVAQESVFLLGKLSFESHNYPEAQGFFEQYASKHGQDKLTMAAALAGIAACQESQGQYQEAMAKYLEAYEFYPDGPLADDYEVSVLRMAVKLGDLAAAGERLTSINEHYPGTDKARDATLIFYEAGGVQPSL